MSPATRDLIIVHRDDYSHTITIVDADSVAIVLTGRTYAAQIRYKPAVAGTADATFSVSLANLATGIVTISLTDTQTDALTPGRAYYWDLQETVTATSFVTTILSGKVTVVQDVTV